MVNPVEIMLSAKDVHTYYGDSYIIQGVSLSVPAGKIVSILGRNGMGKTTIIRSIAGLTRPRRGEITFKNIPLQGLAPSEIARLGIALVPQGRRIFPSLTVRENLMLPASFLARGAQRGLDKAYWNLSTIFQEFPQLAERAKHPGGKLSGGEQQMLAISRALMANPRLILMDEPSEGLAPVIVQRIEDLMRRLRQKGYSILLVEQHFSLAMALADYVYVISAGRFVYEGPPEDLAKEKEVLDRHLGI